MLKRNILFVYESIMSSKVSSIIIIILIASFVFLTIVAFPLFMINNQLLNSGSYAGKYYINPKTDSVELNKICNADDAYESLIQYLDVVENQKEFKMVCIGDNNIDLIGIKKLPLDFSCYYDGNNEQNLPFDPYNYEANTFVVRGIQVNPYVFSEFSLSLSEGTFFNENDCYYDFDSAHEYPIVLGSDYRDYFSIGDSIILSLSAQAFTGKVIGFLNENSRVFFARNEVVLDKYVVTPSFIFREKASDEEELWFQMRILSSKLYYDLVSDKPANDIEADFLAAISGIKLAQAFKGLSGSVHNIKFFGLELSEFVKLLIGLAAISFVFALLIISVIMIMKISRSMNKYAIHLICGASIANICFCIILEIIIYFALADIVVFTLILSMGTMFNLSNAAVYLFVPCIGMILFIAIAFIAVFKLRASDLTKYIKG